MLQHKIARINARWKTCDPHINRFGQQHIEYLIGPPSSGIVTVEHQHNAIGITPQELGVSFAKRCAQHSNDILNSSLTNCKAVGITLHNNCSLGGANGLVGCI